MAASSSPSSSSSGNGRRIKRTVGLRLTAWYAAIFLTSVTAIGLLAYWLLAASLERRDHDLLEAKLGEYAEQYVAGGVDAVQSAVASRESAGEPDIVLVRLIGRQGELRMASVPSAWRAFDLNTLNGIPDSGDEIWQRVAAPGREMALEVVTRQILPGLWLQVGHTTIARDQFLSRIRDLLGVLVAVVLVAGLAGGAVLTRSGLRPLIELRDTVRRIGRTGRLDARVSVTDKHDLVADLGRVFNTMLGRIETLVEGMRGALDSVAHDLRTPIARLRARAETALSSDADLDTCRETLAECVEEADRVIALLTTLMDISEAETGTMRLTVEAVGVDAIAADTVELYEDAAEDRGIALTTEVPPAVTVRADRQRLRQVLANLVDNAIKYTAAGGRVTLGAERGEEGIVITVADTGSGIAAADLPRIFDRLYRGSEGRSEPGLGLGLSLVRAIVAAHGGSVTVDSEPGRGSTFQVTLPAIAQPAGIAIAE